jgi:thioredoxin 1
MSTASFIQDGDLDTLLASSGLVVVDCTASWCGPCKVIGPLIDQLSEEYEGRAQVVKVDVDANKATAKRFGVRSIPAILIFKDGMLVETLVGVKPYDVLVNAISLYL